MKLIKVAFSASAVVFLIQTTPLSALVDPLPFKVPPAEEDKQAFQPPDRVQLGGWIGSRFSGNEVNRLAKMDTDRLLEGFRKRPGRQDWDGEYVGKWLDAATLAWVNTGDPALRAKMDYTFRELAKCQLADGYLGTYEEKNHWSSWDVWIHEYDLIGLITYARYTGNQDALGVCRRIADLLCNTFGDTPGKRDIIASGPHMGMASTSLLEPMSLLYRLTGEPRYLDFCKYLVRSWDQPDGPHILSRLLDGKGVNEVGDAKAYEMMFCINGALEFYRTTGDPKILQAVLNAWQDIVSNRLYITGTASSGESFHANFELPNNANVGETCVTVTWMQINANLLRLTGQARFAEQLEHTTLNQLFGAQNPNCNDWGYYVQMEGKKPYTPGLYCCTFSGPRGVSLIPTFVESVDADGLVLNLYESGKAALKLRDGTDVGVITETQYPADEHVRITVNPAAKKVFAVKFRVPEWCKNPSVTVEGEKQAIQTGADGYAAVKRTWSPGDQLELVFPMTLRVVLGDHINHDKAALMYGPLVLAADASLVEKAGQKFDFVTLASSDAAALGGDPTPAPEGFKTWPGSRAFTVNTIVKKSTTEHKAGVATTVPLVSFADAGVTGAYYKVWIPLRQFKRDNLLPEGVESRSRPGNTDPLGSIIDERPETYVVTYDGKPAAEDWYAVTLPEPIQISRVIFAHGHNFHDGGWFDVSAGKPKVQIQSAENGPWQTVGELTDYPAATATDNAKLKDGQSFTLKLAQPVTVLAVRVIGTPATGDSPKQAFSSCAELQAFAK
jgi:DUF1680 family protein